jgi:sigma-B regulation protein RsbQ
MMFAHGYGCDQHMWRHVAPAFAADYRIVLFDLAGFGRSDLSAYDREQYDTLARHADDVLDIVAELDLTDIVFVGHSVSAMIGVLAAAAAPERFARLVLVGPSPRYIDDGDYTGGFSRGDIDELLDTLDSNYLGWSSTMAPVIMGNADRPDLSAELTNSFCRTDPDIARHFARVTFLSDNRRDLARVRTPTLVLQCTDDAIAPEPVGVVGSIDRASSTAPFPFSAPAPCRSGSYGSPRSLRTSNAVYCSTALTVFGVRSGALW